MRTLADTSIILWLAAPLPLFVGSLLLFRRAAGIPTLLILVGASAYFLWRLQDLSLDLLLPYVSTHHDSRWVRIIWPTDTPQPAFNTSTLVFALLSFCFPVGFVWFVLRLSRRI